MNIFVNFTPPTWNGHFWSDRDSGEEEETIYKSSGMEEEEEEEEEDEEEQEDKLFLRRA